MSLWIQTNAGAGIKNTYNAFSHWQADLTADVGGVRRQTTMLGSIRQQHALRPIKKWLLYWLDIGIDVKRGKKNRREEK